MLWQMKTALGITLVLLGFAVIGLFAPVSRKVRKFFGEMRPEPGDPPRLGRLTAIVRTAFEIGRQLGHAVHEVRMFVS